MTFLLFYFAEEHYKVETKIIEADFSEGNKIYSDIEKELFGLDVGVLVNNVGVSYPYPDYFLELKDKEKIYYDIVQCNIVSVLAMCQIVMPGMVKKKKGVVINISSAAASFPSPMLSVYGASKVRITLTNFLSFFQTSFLRLWMPNSDVTLIIYDI